MKHSFLALTLILFLGLIISPGTSCKKISEDITAANALIGTWRPDGASTIVSVDDEDIIQYLTENFGYSTQEAQDIKEDILSEVPGYELKNISFYGTRNYELIRTDSTTSTDKWSVSPDGKELNLHFGADVDTLKMSDQTSSSVTLKLPEQSVAADFDQDGEVESEVDVNTTMKLAKSSKGGIGQ